MEAASQLALIHAIQAIEPLVSFVLDEQKDVSERSWHLNSLNEIADHHDEARVGLAALASGLDQENLRQIAATYADR